VIGKPIGLIVPFLKIIMAEEKYWCPNSLRSSWICDDLTIELPHPLVLEGGVQNCKRGGGCSMDVLVKDMMVYV
jgi:hypothetical protein